MINLLPRQIEIIEFLLEHEDYEPAKVIAEYMKCSSKTVRNDLKVIEQYLIGKKMNIEKKPGIGIRLAISSEERMKLNLLVNSNKNNQKCELSTEARRIKILSDLLGNSNYNTSIQKLSEKYYISKTSIVNDLKIIEENLKPYNLKFERSQQGTRVIGSEENIRKVMGNLIDDLINSNENLSNSEPYRIDSATFKELSKQFNRQDVALVERILNETEKKLMYTIGEPYYINIVTHVLILINRIQGGNSIFKSEYINEIKVTDKKVYEVSTKMAEMIEDNFKINLPKEEVFFIYQYLVSSGVGFSSLKLENEKMLSGVNLQTREIAKEMIKLGSYILQVDLNIDKQLFKNLILHLKPMLNRIKYKIYIKNPLLQEVRKQFHMVFGMVSLVMLLISEKFNLQYISEDEIAYLVIYFEAALEQCMSQKRVIVVCSSGIGTSHLLKNRIKKSFPTWDIVDVVPKSCLVGEIDFTNIDFIISTVKIRNAVRPVAYVTALFNDNDVKNVTELLVKDALKEERYKTTFETLKRFLYVDYINIVEKGKNDDIDAVRMLLDKITKVTINNLKETFTAKTIMNDNFEIYLCNKSCVDYSKIGMNIIKKYKNHVKIQIILSLHENYEVKINLIVELLQLFNNPNIIEKIGNCKNSKQVLNILDGKEGKDGHN